MKLLLFPFKLLWWLIKLPFLILKLFFKLIPQSVKNDFGSGSIKVGGTTFGGRR